MRADLPLSEHFRVAAEKWCDANAAAEILEEGKGAFLSQKMLATGETAVSKAEMIVKGSKEWADYIKAMCAARDKANRMKMQLELVRMQHSEWQSKEATARAERRL